MADRPNSPATITELCQNFAAVLPERFQAIAQCHRALLDGDQDVSRLAELIRLVHNLSGTARTYGFQAVGETAKAIELALQPFLEAKQMPSPDVVAGLEPTLANLQRLCTEAASNPPSQAEPSATVAPALEGTLVYLLEDDPAQAQFLAAQLRHFGYRVEHFQDIVSLCQVLRRRPPKAQIFDIVTQEGPMAGVELAAKLRQQAPRPVPVVFISARDDITARLEAVRAGGAAYLTKPVDINRLVDVLDGLTAKNPPRPYRVLIIDDERSVASYHEGLLRDAGMETEIVTQPLDALNRIADFAPEIILMDMYMPDCTGDELAQVIRQSGNYNAIPIIFLSAEQDAQKQHAALSSGADDFLTKPIDPEALIRSVSIRAERSRMVNAMMVRDSMTGLLNHARSKEMLASEVERARRKKSELSVAMIDIDKFKSINDTYGHPVGDRVIKSLARLIKERLRMSDSAGRYGGEEFIAILPECSAQQAARIVDDLRLRFGEIRHSGGQKGGEFNATFSAGIASFPVCASVEEIVLSADAALYEAKRRGRNRVVIATQAVKPS